VLVLKVLAMFLARIHGWRHGASEFEILRVGSAGRILQPSGITGEQFSDADGVFLGVSFQELRVVFRQLHGQSRCFHGVTLVDLQGKTIPVSRAFVVGCYSTTGTTSLSMM
jgi:hypothetical protein